MIAFYFLVSVLWLPINLYFWLTKDALLHGIAALLNVFCIAFCVPHQPKGDRK